MPIISDIATIYGSHCHYLLKNSLMPSETFSKISENFSFCKYLLLLNSTISRLFDIIFISRLLQKLPLL